jgi:hypothetical protein
VATRTEATATTTATATMTKELTTTATIPEMKTKCMDLATKTTQDSNCTQNSSAPK